MSKMDEMAYVFGTIFTLSNRLQLLGDRLDAKLTVKQWLFLAGVIKCCHGAPTLSEVAAHIGTSRQNVKKIAAILEKQDFIRMERDPYDARAIQINLTDMCRTHLKQREGMEQRFIEALFSGFNSEDVAVLADMLKRLERNTNEIEKQLEEV